MVHKHYMYICESKYKEVVRVLPIWIVYSLTFRALALRQRDFVGFLSDEGPTLETL